MSGNVMSAPSIDLLLKSLNPDHSRSLAIRPSLDADLCVICRRRREGVASSAFLDLTADPSPIPAAGQGACAP